MITALFAATSAPVASVRISRPVLASAIDRAYFAACLATGFRSPETDAHRIACGAARKSRSPAPSPASLSADARALLSLHEHARRTVASLEAVTPRASRAAIQSLAVEAQQRIVALPVEDRAAVGVWVVRELIDDAAVRCVGLDRAVRDAARAHGCEVTVERMAMGAEIVAMVTRAVVGAAEGAAS